jgi:hypothetical protein
VSSLVGGKTGLWPSKPFVRLGSVGLTGVPSGKEEGDADARCWRVGVGAKGRNRRATQARASSGSSRE